MARSLDPGKHSRNDSVAEKQSIMTYESLCKSDLSSSVVFGKIKSIPKMRKRNQLFMISQSNTVKSNEKSHSDSQSTPQPMSTKSNPIMRALGRTLKSRLADKFSTISKSTTKKDTPKKFEKKKLEAYDWEQSRFYRDYIIRELSLGEPFDCQPNQNPKAKS
jgi:hypothetical protein